MVCTGKRLSLLLFSIIITGLFFGVSGCSPKIQDMIVASVGKDAITLADYEKLYLKNNASRDAGASMTQEEREKFLDLVVKYRLKLADAYEKGLERRPEIINELHQYKGSLAASFLTERDIVGPGTHRLFELRNEELRASHILVQLNRDAAASDSAAAYARAYDIIEQLKHGAPFDSLALVYSQDPSVKQNRGDLYYFTAGNFVPPFEQAAFSMKIGEFSHVPVRTQYGLHIIKIVDRKLAPGDIHCAHIMAQFTRPNPAPEDTLAAYTKIRTIQDSVTKGIDFAELARRNSGDAGSAARGGDLGWFTRRRWVQPFDEAAFKLKTGQISGIVRTPYGYHLIKCIETRPRKTFDESKDEMKQMYQQVRFQSDYDNYLATLKKDLHYGRVDSIVVRFIAAVDTTATTRDSAWASGITPSLGRATIMTIATGPVSVDSVVAMVKARQDLSNIPLRSSQILSMLDKITDQVVFAARAETLERENAEFAAIMREYKEGILLYQIEQDRVWNRIAPSDSLLQLFFSGHRDRFMFPDRLNITEIRASSEDRIKQIRSLLKQGKSFDAIVVDDSARMAMPTNYEIGFTKGSTVIPASGRHSLATVASELSLDPQIRLRLTAHPDTTRQKAEQLRLASKRQDAILAYLTHDLKVDEGRITKQISPLAPSPKGTKERARAIQVVDVSAVGRQPLVLGKPETFLVSVKSDERANAADTLATGTYSSPFSFKGNWEIVRLDAREPARQKTFEEAGPEVSSAFQEAESKRLEAEWLTGLREQHPVIERKETLKNAFAPER
jgi:peptidyl-prolyl cis-trans isomerase SurA